MPESEDRPASEELTLAAAPEPIDSDDATLAAPAREPRTSDVDGRAYASQPTSIARLLGGKGGPTRFGHYVTLEKLGEGGMGVVYAAYDEKLDRKVAIKLLRAHAQADAAVRLVREAQAMARLSHPNVAQIYEIGEVEGAHKLAFIVMEFIDGVTLRAWRDRGGDPRRTRAELLAVFGAAGRGLAAAHAKGLVHRDFKPDNVMIGSDGRVVVMDFGLAREGGGPERAEGGGEAPDVGTGAAMGVDVDPNVDTDMTLAAASFTGKSSGRTGGGSFADLTATGALMGTPAYMAPEQFKGEATDAKTDQFSFCVALWEALYNQRPFQAVNLAGLTLAVTSGKPEVPAGTEVPAWLTRVLERGLAVAPADRWPSMDALLDALAADPSRRRRGLVAGLGALALVVGAVAGSRVVEQRDEAKTRAACADEGRAIEASWSGALGDELGARFGGAEASTAWTHAVRWMDAYAQDWSALRERACLEARVEGTRDEAQYTRVATCLDEGKSAVEALVEVWRGGDEKVVFHGATAAAGLPPVAACDNQAWLAQRVEPPEASAGGEEVEALRARLVRVEALGLVGEHEAGLSEASAVLAEAEALAWPPVEVEARLAVGRLEVDLGRYKEARVSLERTNLDAIAAAHDLVAVRAAISLASLVGYRLSEQALGRYWGELATKLLERVELEGTIDDAALRSSIGDVQWTAGDYEAARVSYAESLALYEQILGPSHPAVAHQLNNVGYLDKQLGDYAAALRDYQRALELNEAALGPSHPRVGESLTFIGDALLHSEGPEAALPYHERAVAVFEAAFGPIHPQLADALNNLGSTLASLGRDDEALAAYERALEIGEAVYGPDHVGLAITLNNIALANVGRGDLDAAQVMFRRAMALWQASFGPEHQNLAIAHNNIGGTLIKQGKLREAYVELEEARRIFVVALGPNHPYVARSLTLIGETKTKLGELDEARVAYEAAIGVLEAAAIMDIAAQVRFDLAKVLGQMGEVADARSEAKAARAGLVAHTQPGPKLDKKLAELDAWLATLR